MSKLTTEIALLAVIGLLSLMSDHSLLLNSPYQAEQLNSLSQIAVLTLP